MYLRCGLYHLLAAHIMDGDALPRRQEDLEVDMWRELTAAKSENTTHSQPSLCIRPISTTDTNSHERPELHPHDHWPNTRLDIHCVQTVINQKVNTIPVNTHWQICR